MQKNNVKENKKATIRLTTSQALLRYMIAQNIEQIDEQPTASKAKRLSPVFAPAFAAVWGIFGHGNVAGLGEALYEVRAQLPTFRGQNEQSMAHIAIAYTKQMKRRRMMAVTSSIGPGASNMVTACALAYINRLPVLFLPGDVFASRAPDPVLQQAENFTDGTISVNDCFRPISRYFDRITRPEQLLTALPKAMSVLTDPANCGPVTLSLCQDVQAEAYDYPSSFFTPRNWLIQKSLGDERALTHALDLIQKAERPIIIAGGGVRYANANQTLSQFSQKYGIPVAETQAGKSSLAEDHPFLMGSVGVTGSDSANNLIRNSDLILVLGSRLQDFTTGSNALMQAPIITMNLASHDAIKHQAYPLICDVQLGLEWLEDKLPKNYHSSKDWQKQIIIEKKAWQLSRKMVTSPIDSSKGKVINSLPSDSEVIGAVNRAAPKNTIVIGAAGSMPGELHKLWQAENADGYHMEYGFSCMGYEIAAGLGVQLASPDRPALIFVGDGSYMMMNSEIVTAVMMGLDMTIIVTDNRGYGCINRLQAATGGAAFNNLYQDSHHQSLPMIDFVAHAASMGAKAHKIKDISEMEAAVRNHITQKGVHVLVIDSDPGPSTEAGGCWWEVAVPAVSSRKEVNQAYDAYQQQRKLR